MGIEIRIEGDTCFQVAQGAFTANDFIRAWTAVMQRPEFTPPMKAVFDIRQLERSIPAEEIEIMVEFCKSVKERFSRRSAIVSEPGTLVYGLVRIFCAISENQGIEFPIYPTIEEAVAWIKNNDPATSLS